MGDLSPTICQANNTGVMYSDFVQKVSSSYALIGANWVPVSPAPTLG